VSCSGAPKNGGCSVSQQTVTLDGVTQQHLTLTVNTGAAAGSLATAGLAVRPPRSAIPLLEWLSMLAFSLLSMALLRRSRRKYATWLCLLLMVCVGGLIGCASRGSSSGATPPGTYTVFVHATSGNITQNASVMLYVK
jgi:apolipoprotein N-acyltransferase